MASPLTVDANGNVTISGQLHVKGAASFDTAFLTNSMVKSNAAIARTKLAQDGTQAYMIPWTAFRVHDALQTNLPGTAATDDLGLIGGTFGSASPVIQTSDAKATSVTQRARFQVALPPEYVDGETVTLRVHAGMNTTVSDGTATVDVECYESDKEGGVGSDICSTSATTINSLTAADVDFTITPSGLVSGDVLDVRVTIAITDSATGTAVIGEIGYVALLLDVKG